MPTDRRSLPVIIPKVPDQKFDCQSCTRCCRELLVQLSDEDRTRIDSCDWVGRLGVAPYVRLGGRWVLNKRDDGRCVFLADDNLCRIHSEQGFAAKPLPCRLFPFTLIPSARQIRAAWRFDCPTIAKATGRSITQHSELLADLAGELNVCPSPEGPPIHLQPGLVAEAREIEHLERALDSWLANPGRPYGERLQGAVWLTLTLAQADFRKVRGDRFIELIDLLIGALPEEIKTQTDLSLSARQLGLFRQLTFAHTGHLRFSDLKGGLWSRWKIRKNQLERSRCFRRGQGLIPAWKTGDRPLTFVDVEAIRIDPAELPMLRESIIRYVRSRLLTRTCYGPGYYGWSVVDGLTALWLAVTAAGWWSRYFAARNQAVAVGSRHWVEAIAVVDGAAGRIPALGTTAERIRLSYLRRNNALRTLIERYWPLDP